jgi:hypothetical protein
MTLRMAITLAAVLAVPEMAAAQKLDQAKSWEVGDKVVMNWTLNNKAQKIELEITEASSDGITGVQRVSGKEFRLAGTKPGVLTAAMCASNGQPCTFSPALNLVELPLEKGKKWPVNMTVKGDTFTAQVESERVVEKVEKVKVPAGEFEAYRIAHSGRIRGSDQKGSGFSGKEDGKYWIAVINGKLAVVKSEYRNSFGEKVTEELASAALK